MSRRFVIAGTESGVGKTTITVGLMAAFHQQGFKVQGFKCGPDYIDPSFHSAVTGRISRNLDSWMMKKTQVKEAYLKGSEGADLSIIEGVMGLYDGREPTTDIGSTAEIASILSAPVVLVVNSEKIARSVAAMVQGYQHFSQDIRIAGVIANFVYGDGHYRYVKEAVEQECGIPVFGYMAPDEQLSLPERHLGLVPALEKGDLSSYFEQLGIKIQQRIDIQKMIEATEAAEITPPKSPLLNRKNNIEPSSTSVPIRIAVARDAAFHFYYQENLELLAAGGAELVYFSPLAGEKWPDNTHGLYIGGGFPEVFAEQLSEQEDVHQSIRDAVEQGLPVYAECGGFMYLTEEVRTSEDRSYPLVGIIPGRVKMHQRLQAIGYRTVKGTTHHPWLPLEIEVRGHEYHYSTYEPPKQSERTPQYAYYSRSLYREQQEGFVYKNVVAGYTHLHFLSCPTFALNWLKLCQNWKAGREMN